MGKPLTILVKPASSLCNMRCRYCFYADVSDKRQVKCYNIMSAEVQEILVRSVLKEAEGFCSFAFQGGEPTLAGLNYFKRHVKLCQNYNINNVKIYNSIQTNGYVINDEWADFFARNNFLVGVSLDGPKDIHDYNRTDNGGNGTFNRVIRAIRLLKKYNVEFNILTVISKQVAQNASMVYKFFKNNGLKFIQFIPCLDGFDSRPDDKYSLTAEDFGKFFDVTFNLFYKDYIKGEYVSIRTFDNYINMLMGGRPECCGMAGFCTSYYVVEGDGSVYPCDFYVIDKYRMGNVVLNRFDAMSDTVVSKTFVAESNHVDERCRKCLWLSICRGGCRRNREPFVNGKPGLNVFCEGYRYFFERNIEKLLYLAKTIKNERIRREHEKIN